MNLRRWWVTALLFLWAGYALGQSTTGTFLGTVTDATGALVHDASIRVIHQETNRTRTASTNESGNYSISNLPAGDYRIEVEQSGFRKEVRTQVVLGIDEKERVDFALSVGPASETVTVTADHVRTETDDASMGTVIDGATIRRLPLNGRQFEFLVQLLPGAATAVPGSHLSTRGGFNFAGLDEHMNSFLLDGIDNVDPVIRNFSYRPSVDLVDEFKVQESGYNAEFGRNAGAVINVTTRSGTNQFHGSAWEFLRNDALDARNFFAPAGTKPATQRNQFGVTEGGPIRTDRTFFFAAYEGLRQKVGQVRRATVPTERMRAGDLGELGVTVIDPVTKLPFAGAIIPPVRFNPVAAEVLQAYPLPNRPGIVSNRIEIADRIDNGNDFSGRLDHQLFGNTQLMGRYSTSRTRVRDPFRTEGSPGVNLSAFGQTADRFRTNAEIALTTLLGHHAVNDFRVGYNRFRQPQLPLNSGTPLQVPLMGFEKAFLGYRIGSTLDPLGSGQEFKRTVNVYNYIDNLSLGVGNHQLKLGVDVRRYLFNFYAIGPNQFQFTGAATGAALGDFLLGLPSTAISSTGSPSGNTRKTEMAAYIQDDWKIAPRITLNYGLRWDFYGRISERVNKQSMWVAGCNCIQVAGAGLPEQLVPDDFNNFAPRFGIVFRPDRERTTLRASGGIYYDSDMRHNAEVVGNPPFLNTQLFLAPLNPGLSLSNPFNSTLGLPLLAPLSLDPKYRDTYSENWNFSIQRELGAGFFADISYIGNHVLKIRRLRNIDQPVNFVPPYPGFSGVLVFEQAGSSTFNALQTKLERHVARGATMTAAYTWGHAIDDRPGQGSGRIQDNYNLRAERADADYDVRHRLSVSGAYELPWGAGRRWGAAWGPAATAILGGWSLDGIAILQGGRPFTVFMPQLNNSLSGNGNDRPNAVAGIDWRPANQGPDHWINSAAFSLPALGTFGNLGRNTLRGPGFSNVDMSLAKEFLVRDRTRIQLRTEFFNLLNHPNFSFPDATIDFSPAGNPNFGMIPSTAGSERQIQFGVRLEY